jgi:LAO/AO transport system kinase
MGDEIQATKAGILESADIFVVNKADREGADSAVHDLEGMLALAHGVESRIQTGGHGSHLALRRTPVSAGWTPPIVRTVALGGEGVGELVSSLASHRAHLRESGQLALRRRARDQLLLMTTVQQELMHSVMQGLAEEVCHLLDRIQNHELDPYDAAETLCRHLQDGAVRQGAT